MANVQASHLQAIAHFCDDHPAAYRFADCDCEVKVKCIVQECKNLGTHTGLFGVPILKRTDKT